MRVTERRFNYVFPPSIIVCTLIKPSFRIQKREKIGSVSRRRNFHHSRKLEFDY